MTATTYAPAHRTAHQIVENKTGKPYAASVTSNLWVTGANIFADHTEDNKVIAFTTGKAYFEDLISTCRAAQKEICIAGWQVNWDALLARGVRLYDLLRDVAKANPSVSIYVMPWSHSLPVETYDGQTRTVLLDINAELKTNQVHVFSSPSYAPIDQRFFAHHQKQIVVDRKIAYLGGMDVCYGRYDDDTYDLRASAHGREAMNRYNGCVEQIQPLKKTDLVNPDLMSGVGDTLRVPHLHAESAADGEIAKLHQPGHWQTKYKIAGGTGIFINAKKLAADEEDLTTLDENRQPRMPWQDVHCRIEGPAVSPLLRNFVLRWNIVAKKASTLPMPITPQSYPRVGKAHVQVLRSAPGPQCAAEFKALEDERGIKDSAATQDDICRAMLLLIDKSRRFIYIENQFFVGDFGTEAPRPADLTSASQFINSYAGGRAGAKAAAFHSENHATLNGNNFSDVLRPPTNPVIAALIKRITQTIMAGQPAPFHLYVTLPVHPEGTLSTANVVTQVYWTMQTLVFGSQSLLNGVRRALKARELMDKPDPGYKRAFHEGNTEYEDIDYERCNEYVTLLNLRNWAKLGDRYVTEQVYIHTKAMIVDDMFAIVGSANINDRSMLGDRDSELSVLVCDGETKRANVNGAGSQREVRVFAHELRKAIWKKIFGITGGIRPATELAQAIEEPGKPDSWRLIQRRATKNASLYEAAFPWIPRSQNPFSPDPNLGASILPTWNSEAAAPQGSKWGSKGRLESPMPFQKEFWDEPRHVASAVGGLEQIKGFITALPIMWTKGENNRFEYPTPLVADNDLPPSAVPMERPSQAQSSKA